MARILFVTKYHYLRYIGGAELQCWMLAREFQRRGWDVHYVSENDRPDAPADLDGIRLHYVPEFPNWKEGNRGGIQRVIKEIRPDVVYNRVFDLYTAHAINLAPKHAVTVWAAAGQHDGEVASVLGDIWQTKSLMQFLVLLPQTLWTRKQAQRAALRAKIHLAQSKEQIERLSALGFHPKLIRNSLQSTIDVERQAHEGKPLVLWVGSVKQWKRPELFFELANRCKDLDCEFVMVGDLQDKQSEASLERAQRELSNFRYAGFVAPDLIGKLYDKAHLLVSTSRAEGFPNTFIQSWLRGVPVLSLDVNPDRLLGPDGLGAIASTMDDLEHKLREFLADPNLRGEVGRRAHEFAKKEFDLQANMDKLEDLIRGSGVPRTD